MSDFPTLWKEAKIAWEREKMLAKGDLYFIRAGDAVKIGRTRDVAARVRNIQANNHEEVDCLVVLKGRGHEEKVWHQQFRDGHIRGEWFRWSPEIELAVNEARQSNMAAAA